MGAGMKLDPLLLEQDARLSGWRNPVARMQEALDRWVVGGVVRHLAAGSRIAHFS